MPSVVVYSKKPCVMCTATLRWLTDKKRGFKEGEHFEVRSIPDFPAEIEAFKVIGLMEAPIVVIEDLEPFPIYITGFNPTELEKHLGPFKPAANAGT